MVTSVTPTDRNLAEHRFPVFHRVRDIAPVARNHVSCVADRVAFERELLFSERYLGDFFSETAREISLGHIETYKLGTPRFQRSWHFSAKMAVL